VPVTLEALGVSAVHEQVYRQLVDISPARAGELGAHLGLTEPEVGVALDALMAFGLALVDDADRGRFIAASPAVALGSLINERRNRLHQAEISVTEMIERYRTAAGGRAVRDLIEVVTGTEAVGHRFVQVQSTAEREVMAFVTADTLAVSREQNDVEPAAVERGVIYRVLIERAILEQPGAIDIMALSLENGEQVRVVDRVPHKLLIADRTTALVPLRVSGDPGAVVVYASGLLDALVALFEAFWARAIPLRLSSDADRPVVEDGVPGAIEPLDLKILALLFAGLTDRAVATQLDISMRTVARRVRHLMDLAGVQTRLQLGRHAAIAGWF
jgi:sugar-specific transcriptional regulator TrmB/DNA-binding CsgD family transcriptional regulator